MSCPPLRRKQRLRTAPDAAAEWDLNRYLPNRMKKLNQFAALLLTLGALNMQVASADYYPADSYKAPWLDPRCETACTASHGCVRDTAGDYIQAPCIKDAAVIKFDNKFDN